MDWEVLMFSVVRSAPAAMRIGPAGSSNHGNAPSVVADQTATSVRSLALPGRSIERNVLRSLG